MAYHLITGFHKFICAFPIKIKAFQCIITPVIGFRINSALTVHFLHSLGSIPASRHITGTHMPTTARILPGPHLYTWVESSNVDKLSSYRATVGIEPGLSVWQSSGHTTIPNLKFGTDPGPCSHAGPTSSIRIQQNSVWGGGGGGVSIKLPIQQNSI